MLKHRGPDDEGIYISRQSMPYVGLGHRRLKIIDLSQAGHQPMANEDGKIWIVLNGEIYNYRDLRKDLEGKGHVFKSNTDTEAVIHLYEEYGEECVKYLRGMFAFAVWDEPGQKLLLARDRVGKKPLLYFHQNGRFCFASEFTAILASGLADREINQPAIDYYLSLGYIPAPLSIYRNIFKLLPGHILVLKDNAARIKRYWELDYAPKIKISEEEASEEILRLLKEATRIRLYSDVPLGAFLSGGVDSSTVVGLMSGLFRAKVKTFSIGFEEKAYSELKYAGNIARRFDTDHHELVVKPKAMEVIPLLVERYGEPYADPSCIPTYYVSQQTRNYVTVALNGDGGDESFAGYERYQAMLAAESFQRSPFLLRAMARGIAGFIPDSADSKNRLRRIRRFFEAAALPQGKRYLRWVSFFDEGLKNTLRSPEFAAVAAKNDLARLEGFLLYSPVSPDPAHRRAPEPGLLDRLLKTDVQTYLPNDLLAKVDIASMANSLEARSPFLDHELMEFAARLPAEYKIKGLVKKYILKKAIRDLVPPENIHRGKMGFGIPVGEWFRGDLRGFLRENLLSKKSLGRGYFKPEIVKDIIEQHISRRRDYTLQLWALLMLELWHRRFLD
jgi:asparagine synthase (glutamine-hydrolysing)